MRRGAQHRTTGSFFGLKVIFPMAPMKKWCPWHDDGKELCLTWITTVFCPLVLGPDEICLVMGRLACDGGTSSFQTFKGRGYIRAQGPGYTDQRFLTV